MNLRNKAQTTGMAPKARKAIPCWNTPNVRFAAHIMALVPTKTCVNEVMEQKETMR